MYFHEGKWGYKQGDRILVSPQYDTAFAFDKYNKIALVANKNRLSKTINPLSGSEEIVYDYFFIDRNNHKIELKENASAKPIYTFDYQQDLHLNYLNTKDDFKIIYNSKVYLFTKDGKQVCYGYDDIQPSVSENMFIVEDVLSRFKETERVYGVITKTEGEILKPKFHGVKLNLEDSLIIACNAVFNYSLADEVFDFKGKLIYSNKNHIEYASKTLKVMKVFEPEEHYEFFKDASLKKNELSGEEFKLINYRKAIIIDKERLVLVDLETLKTKIVGKEKLQDNLNRLIMDF